MTKQAPVSFTKYFNIDKSRLSELGVFDPILNSHTKLFVEPLLLKQSSDKIIKNSYENYRKFFSDILTLRRNYRRIGDSSTFFTQAVQLLNLPEYNFTCIGHKDDERTRTYLAQEISQSVNYIAATKSNNADVSLLLPDNN